MVGYASNFFLIKQSGNLDFLLNLFLFFLLQPQQFGYQGTTHRLENSDLSLLRSM